MRWTSHDGVGAIEQINKEKNDHAHYKLRRAKFGLKVEILPVPTGADLRSQMPAEGKRDFLAVFAMDRQCAS